MAEREITLEEFLQVMSREPGNAPRPEKAEPHLPIVSNCPWYDAVEFCNKLSLRENLSPSYGIVDKTVTVMPKGTGYRLPTEAQWEFACRAGTATLWHYGLSADDLRRDPKNARTHDPYKSYDSPANAFGLYNVYSSSNEWCWDRFDPNYYRACAAQGTVTDPQGSDTGNDRVMRGGSNFSGGGSDLAHINSATRHHGPPDVAHGYRGFGRIVLPVKTPSE